jgi:hypothetical protein
VVTGILFSPCTDRAAASSETVNVGGAWASRDMTGKGRVAAGEAELLRLLQAAKAMERVLREAEAGLTTTGPASMPIFCQIARDAQPIKFTVTR